MARTETLPYIAAAIIKAARVAGCAHNLEAARYCRMTCSSSAVTVRPPLCAHEVAVATSGTLCFHRYDKMSKNHRKTSN